jgi:ferredoxin
MALKISIDRQRCMASGNCNFWAPGVFDQDDEGYAFVVDPDAQPRDKVEEAARFCPTGAIVIEEQ